VTPNSPPPALDGETWQAKRFTNVPEAPCQVLGMPIPSSLDRKPISAACRRSGKPDQVADVRLASGYLARTALAVATVELAGAGTLLTVPCSRKAR